MKTNIIVDVLQQRAQEDADKLAFLFLDQGEVESERITFAELDRDARRIANHLLTLTQPGERALLIYPPGLDFIRAFYGCLYAGVLPIPTNPPGRNRSVQRLMAISQDAQASLGLTTPEFLTLFGEQLQQFPPLRALNWQTHDTLQSDPDLWRRPNLAPDSLAFIQYTSGSTASPRGVMISHHNLSYSRDVVANGRKRELSPDAVILGWSPIFHDMGLILGVVQGIYDNNPSVLMSPIAFMQRPARWLEAITKYKATISGGPNFSFEICANKVTAEERANLDLSSWKLAFNSAEPVRKETQDRFYQTFAECGFQYETFYPCYGMAEATLLLSIYGNEKKTLTFPADRAALEEGRIVEADPEGGKNTQLLVNCGQPILEVQAAIVDPATKLRLPPDQVGEIWISADNVGQGYWNRPEDTEYYFRAYIQDTGEGPFMRTGDLGFMNDGDLYVTGRLKDLIIVRGRNYYPQDVEFTVEKCHPAIQPGGGASFALTIDGVEQLVVVSELRKQALQDPDTDYDQIIKTIRFAIAGEQGIRAYAVVLIQRGSIPKTSSGKIMRSATHKLFQKDALDVVKAWQAPQ